MDAALAVQHSLEARDAWKFPSPTPTSPKKASAAGATYPVAGYMLYRSVHALTLPAAAA